LEQDTSCGSEACVFVTLQKFITHNKEYQAVCFSKNYKAMIRLLNYR
jgi:hypothetical protein